MAENPEYNIQWPFVRLSYEDVQNPIWSADIAAINQGLLDACTAIAGLGPNDFAIFNGLTYEVAISGPNYYLPGTFYLKGNWYFMPNDFDEGLYLTPNVGGINDWTFSEDASVRPTYNDYLATTSSSGTGNTPQFEGNMNAYRMDLKTVNAILQNLQMATTVVSTLPASYTVYFTNDLSLFFEAATVNTTIHFNFTGAIPGTVVTLKWTFASTESLSIPPTAGQSILLESGDQSNVANNTNLLYILYAGINEVGLPEVRINLSQPTIPT